MFAAARPPARAEALTIPEKEYCRKPIMSDTSQGSASLMQPFLRLIGSKQVGRSRRILPSAFRTLKSSLVLNLHVVTPGSNAAAIDVRTELDTERYPAPQEPGFRHIYAT